MQVRIISKSACLSCTVKGACNISEIEEKLIDVSIPNNESYKNGDRVEVFFAESLGTKAVILGYILPFVFMFGVLIISLNYTSNELYSGLLSLGTLLPYYLVLYLLRKNHKKEFSFSVRKFSQ